MIYGAPLFQVLGRKPRAETSRSLHGSGNKPIQRVGGLKAEIVTDTRYEHRQSDGEESLGYLGWSPNLSYHLHI